MLAPKEWLPILPYRKIVAATDAVVIEGLLMPFW